MGASVDLVGTTEAETLVNYLKWLNGWSKKILRGMKMLYNSVETVRNKHHFGSNIDELDKSVLVAQLDETAVLLDGPATAMRHSFDLHHIGSEDGELPIHMSLERAMDEIQQMCEGKKEVPVKDPLEYVSKKELIPSIPATFSSYVKQMCGLAKKIQDLLRPLDLDGGATKPHFVLNMTIVDQRGRPIKIEQFDLDQIVNEFNEKRLQEQIAQLKPDDLPGGKEGDGQIQPTS